ncbi:uncharacterized protein [Epargyreus clarus]|uniref:uncharacterized protein n=1 Tax=Epargyreus clarus TaxID=520877 RepID=UPI003C2BE82F
MSFVDLATLAVHRRHEMEARINGFLKKCDLAIQNVMALQVKAQGFVEQLNCDPSELKDRFLNCMKQLDEFMYLITDFNLAMAKLGKMSEMESTPVQDIKNKAVLPLPSSGAFNLIDALSEPTPSTSKACQNQCPSEQPRRKKVPREDQMLIMFSSNSCSSESVIAKNDVGDREVQCSKVEKIEDVTNEDTKHAEKSIESCNLPAQTVLQVDYVYNATIMHVDCPSFWVITDKVDDVYDLMTDMTNYYKANQLELTLDDVMTLTYCAFYDEESDCYYRALFIRLTEEDMSMAELFVVDTGEVRVTPITNIQPLVPAFCTKPPYARCCHLAGVEVISYQEKQMVMRQDDFMNSYIGTVCSIEVDDNTSESLGVYVTLPSGQTLNDVIVKEGLAIDADKTQAPIRPSAIRGPPELTDVDLDITQGPEYEDPVEAVTGYHNRDEIDICKHYKGGPEKTCFKGSRCNKRHVVKHPDGWTLDRVCVPVRVRAPPLPAPGAWLRVRVTHVAHFDRFYVHLVTDREKETVPSFGVVLPPTTLEGLIRDMNSPATRLSYKPLKTIPAPGELVAALYPLDGQWYRARVISMTRADQNVEVQYIDYGNSMWVKEDEVRALPARHGALPAQAARCALAGVRARTACSRQWAAARAALAALLDDRLVRAHVIARDYDEITVEVFDDAGESVAEKLVDLSDSLELTEYAVIDDTAVTTKLVVP